MGITPKWAQDKLRTLNGWSKSLEEALIRTNQDIFDTPEKMGSFIIKKVNGKFFWYYVLSKGKSRFKYLCSTEPKDIEYNQTSFQYAFEKLKIKIQSGYRIKTKNSHLLSEFILEYITKHSSDGGYYFDIKKFKLIDDKNIKVIKRNKTTVKNRLIHIRGFYEYCKTNKIPISVVPTSSLTTVVKDYLEYTLEFGKKKGYLNSEKGETIRRPTAKNYLRSVRFFCDWLVRKKSLDGLELFDYHPFTVDFQIELIKKYYKDYVPPEDKNDMVLFYKEDYLKCVKECVEIVREKWISVCKHKGETEQLRTTYNPKVDEDSTLGKKPHRNQPSDYPIGVDIVYFISLLQLRYGFRIGEILKSFRSKEDMIKSNVTDVNMRSYFTKDKKDKNLYLFYILNSKHKNRIVPIDETIWSFHHKPPKGLGYKVEFETKDGKKDFRYETNIIDVCMYLWPKSYYLFSSPNFKKKPNQPLQTNYYLNLFKLKMVNKGTTKVVRKRKKGLHTEVIENGLGWKFRNITSSHHLRKNFISYMVRREGVEPMELCEIVGHTMQTMMMYYKRLDIESGRETLLTNRLKTILNKNRIEQ